MANHKQLKEIAKSRLRASKILMDNEDHDGAFYLMGYVVECALKAVICKKLNLASYPDNTFDDKSNIFKTHKFDILLVLSGMEQDFALNSTQRRSENWGVATKWRPETRYEPIGSHTEPEVARIYEALTEKPDGLISWMTKKRKW